MFAACAVDDSGFCGLRGVTEWSSRLVPRARWLRSGQFSTRNKVFVRYLAVLLRTCTTLLAVRFWGSLHDFTMLRQEAGFCYEKILAVLASVFIGKQHETWGF